MRIVIRRYRYLIAAGLLAVATVAGLGAVGITQANAADAAEVPETPIELSAGADADDTRLTVEDIPAEGDGASSDATELPEQPADADGPRLVADDPSEGEPSAAAATGQVEEAAPGTRLEDTGDAEDGSWHADAAGEAGAEEPYTAAGV